MIIHYNCTIGSFLLHSFLLICHPYLPSFHKMIFILVPLIFLLVVAKLERQGAPKMLIRHTLRTHVQKHYALAQTVPLLSKPRDKAMASFEDSVGRL